MSRLMLIDGNSLTYRAFHALPPDLATASGQVTNAVFGFTSMLINLVRDHRPDGIAVAFDLPEPTFRHAQLTSYKATRDKAPDVLREQMGLVRRVLEVLRLPVLELPGYEADDIIATLATQGAAASHDVLIVTGDRDSFQLVQDPHVKVVYNKRGVSDYALYDEAGIEERTGVKPDLYVQYAALRGDNSDNLPGVPGVGEKTAAKLINTYGGIDGIYANAEAQTPKLRQNLVENEEIVRLNLIIMELVRDAPLDVDLTSFFEREIPDPAEVRQLFDFLEFRTLYDRMQAVAEFQGGSSHDSIDETPSGRLIEPIIVQGSPAGLLATWFADPSSPPLAVAMGTDGGPASFAGIAYVIDAPSGKVGWVARSDLATLAPFVATNGPGIAAHEAKPLLRACLSNGLSDVSLRLDTALASYLLDPSGSSYPLGEALTRRTDWRLPADDGPPEGQLDFGVSGATPARTAAVAALAVARLAPVIEQALVEDGLFELNRTIEVPLVSVLARMEHRGVAADRSVLRTLNDEMTTEADQLAHLIQEDAGEPFNVNSTKKLQEILFEKLGLSPGKKNKTGFSTDQSTLEKLEGQHPIIEHLLRYREVEKLRSTYGESLLAAVDADGRIRATFNQMVARTGRLSSENPNLHNIPVRSELGRTFRKAFRAEGDRILLVADYNQIELRCIAHLAEDPGLIEAFTAGTDVHRAVAARVFGIEAGEVDFEQRSRAKMVSYGLAYGMESYGLGQRLGIGTKEASEILDAYFAGFPNVRSYMDATVVEARNRGYTETLFGRRRAIPELLSDNFRVRQAGERQAMNAGIQGLAADIFKVALVRLDERLEASGLASRIVLQVHDEVILEVPPEEKEAATAIVLEEMSGAFDLAVPLEVNLSYGATWADAKD